MKKTLALLLALAMSCSMLTACSEDDSSSKADNSSSVADSSAADSSAADSSDADTSEPETPDSSEVDSTEPDSSEVDSSEPDSSEVDSSEPDSSEPDLPDHPDTPAGEGIVFGDEIETSDRLFEALVAELEKGTMTMEMDVEQDGLAIYMYVTSDGKNSYAEMDMFGMAITMLYADGNTYYLDAASKKYYHDTTATEDTTDSLISTDDITGTNQEYISTGTVTIDGVEYIAECYDIDGATGYFVFDDDALIGAVDIDPVTNEAKFTPVYLAAEVDSSKLSLPSDYTAMTAQEFAELMGVDMDVDMGTME